ncbi:MAG: hypothetical protein HQL52_02500 [Magnetococcales bacterium]|nr:hypothetical protein [Magnetococcales bacterium]
MGLTLKKLAKWLMRLLISGAILLAIALSLALFLLLNDPAREKILLQVAERSGWQMTVKKAGFVSTPPGLWLEGVGLFRPGEHRFSAERILVGLSLESWMEGRIPALELDHPRIELHPPSDSEPSPPVDKSPPPPEKPLLSWPILPLDRLEIRNGALLPESPEGVDSVEKWGLVQIDATGENLSAAGIDLAFAAEGLPGGSIHGMLHLTEKIRLVARAEKAPLVPLLRLLGIAGERGELGVDMELTVDPGGSVEVTAQGGVARLQLAGGGEADFAFSVRSRPGEVVFQGEGEALPPGGLKRAPVTLKIIGQQQADSWRVAPLQAKVGKLAYFSFQGEAFPNPHLQGNITLIDPDGLRAWLGMAPLKDIDLKNGPPWQIALQVDDSWQQPRWQANIQTGPDQLKAGTTVIKGLESHIDASGVVGETTIPIQFRLSSQRLTTPPYQTQGIVTQGKLTLDIPTNAWTLEQASLQGALLDPSQNDPTLKSRLIRWQGHARGDTQGITSQGKVAWMGAKLDLKLNLPKNQGPHIQVVIPQATPLAIPQALPPGVTLKGEAGGKVHGKLALTLGVQQGMTGQIEATIAQGSWVPPPTPDTDSNTEGVNGDADEPQELFLEGVAGWLQGTFRLDKSGGGEVDGQFKLSAGEWLAGSHYGDLGLEQPAGKGTFQWPGKTGWSLTGDLSSRVLPKFSIKIAPKGNGYSGRVALKGANLEALFVTYLQEALAIDAPDWASAQMGGALDMELDFSHTGQGNPRLKGKMALQEGKFTAPGGGWGIEEIELELPISPKSAGKPSSTGRLTLTGLQAGAVSLPPVKTQLHLHGDQLVFPGEVVLPLFGGRLSIKEVEWVRIWSGEPHLVMGLKLDDLDLDLLAQAFDLPQSGGSLQADFPLLKWRGGQLRTRGELRADLFGGHIRVHEIGGDGLLTSLPLWGMDVTVEKLDLEALTSRTDVGKIQGTLSGGVKRLVMAGGEPVSFDAELANVDGSAPQMINVKAIQNIQALGSGGPIAALERGLFSFFENYRYRRFGFKCRLRNDTFHLKGVEEIKGRHYLVLGSLLPPRVDVISHNPIIAWKDMVERLQRIGLADGPTIGDDPGTLKEGE